MESTLRWINWLFLNSFSHFFFFLTLHNCTPPIIHNLRLFSKLSRAFFGLQVSYFEKPQSLEPLRGCGRDNCYTMKIVHRTIWVMKFLYLQFIINDIVKNSDKRCFFENLFNKVLLKRLANSGQWNIVENFSLFIGIFFTKNNTSALKWSINFNITLILIFSIAIY